MRVHLTMPVEDVSEGSEIMLMACYGGYPSALLGQTNYSRRFACYIHATSVANDPDKAIPV